MNAAAYEDVIREAVHEVITGAAEWQVKRVIFDVQCDADHDRCSPRGVADCARFRARRLLEDTRTLRLIGQCKSCRRPVVEDVVSEKRRGVLQGRAEMYEYDFLRHADDGRQVMFLRCACGRAVRNFRAVAATRTTTPCDASCRDAKGADCRCSCAGEFHGVSHLATVPA